jgi:hypothetical protein
VDAERPLDGKRCGGHSRTRARDTATDVIARVRALPGHYSHGYMVRLRRMPRQPNFRDC